MKVVESTKQSQIVENENTSSSLEFSDVVVYNEMADQTSVKLNLIEQIRTQLNQLEEMNHKRQFLMKEILEVIR
jgi:hypothetical protein